MVQKQVEKLTKVLSELVKENRYSDDQRLDYFHKLRNPNVKYKIYSNIEEITTRYQKVETCLSPGGSNQSNIFRHLYSPLCLYYRGIPKEMREC